jgi:hypothetical protein
MVKGKTEKRIILTLSGDDIEGFMNTVLDEAFKKNQITDVINSIHIVEEHPQCVISEIKPAIWKVILPIMRKYKDDYKVDWKDED